ncbi:hypothetical protein RUND412_004924 [Rhizina undulata]
MTTSLPPASSSTSPYRASSSLRPSSYSATPLTPRHTYTPPTTLHNAEDALVFEIGTRFLRAGFANEPFPRCELDWSTHAYRRAGDRISSVRKPRAKRKDPVGAAEKGELWREDLRGFEVGLVEDLVERAVRVAYNKYLLLDSKTKKLLLPVPPLFPTKLLTVIATTLFTHFQVPTITFIPSPVLATIAAGLRSALVVDIGWHETIVTPVFELRPVDSPSISLHGRCRRAGKVLRETWREFLQSELLAQRKITDEIETEELEEIISRMGWCKKYISPFPPPTPSPSSSRSPSPSPSPSPTSFTTTASTHVPIPDREYLNEDPVVSIPLDSVTPPTSLSLPFSQFSLPAEKTFFAPTTTPSDTPEFPDDDDHPLPYLLYTTLLHLPIDVRAALLSRLIILGGASAIPGLKKRIVDELQGLIRSRGWSMSPGVRSLKKAPVVTTAVPTPLPTPSPSPVPPPTDDDEKEKEQKPRKPVLEKKRNRKDLVLKKDKEKKNEPGFKPGEVRAVRSLGVWVGGSLCAGMKVRGTVEVEREKFLSAVVAGGSGFGVVGVGF